MLPPWPQGNGYADADGGDQDQSDGESNEKAAHCLSFARGAAPIPDVVARAARVAANVQVRRLLCSES